METQGWIYKSNIQQESCIQNRECLQLNTSKRLAETWNRCFSREETHTWASLMSSPASLIVREARIEPSWGTSVHPSGWVWARNRHQAGTGGWESVPGWWNVKSLSHCGDPLAICQKQAKNEFLSNPRICVWVHSGRHMHPHSEMKNHFRPKSWRPELLAWLSLRCQ